MTRESEYKRTQSDRLLDYALGRLDPQERQAVEAELAESPALRKRLEVERTLHQALRSKLEPVPAPPGLETRIRAQLRERSEKVREQREPVSASSEQTAGAAASAPAGDAKIGWFGRSFWSAFAASALTALVLMSDWGPGSDRASVESIEQVAVTVVDRQCDQMGVPVSSQKRCDRRDHHNVLKTDDGVYWQVSLDDERAIPLMADPELRGHRLTVDGQFYSKIKTLKIQSFRDLGEPGLVSRLQEPLQASYRPISPFL